MRKVVIGGIGMTHFGKFIERNLKSLSEEAVGLALKDARVTVNDVDRIFFGNAAAGVVTGQEMIRAQSSLRNTGLDGKPMYNVENACASGSSALNLAWLSVASGQSETALVVGTEKLTHEDKAVLFGAFAKAVDLEEPLPEGVTAGTGSLFMDLYAAKARKWMEKTGAEVSDFARVVVKSRRAGSLNPAAQFRKETTIEEVLRVGWSAIRSLCSCAPRLAMAQPRSSFVRKLTRRSTIFILSIFAQVRSYPRKPMGRVISLRYERRERHTKKRESGRPMFTWSNFTTPPRLPN